MKHVVRSRIISAFSFKSLGSVNILRIAFLSWKVNSDSAVSVLVSLRNHITKRMTHKFNIALASQLN